MSQNPHLPITRFELISSRGREIVFYGPVQIQMQDDGRTVKVFAEINPISGDLVVPMSQGDLDYIAQNANNRSNSDEYDYMDADYLSAAYADWIEGKPMFERSEPTPINLWEDE